MAKTVGMGAKKPETAESKEITKLKKENAALKKELAALKNIVHAVSGSFQNQHRSAARICTARRCHHGSHASRQSLRKAAI